MKSKEGRSIYLQYACFLFFMVPLISCDFTNVRTLTHLIGPRSIAPGGMDEFMSDPPDWVYELEDSVGLIGFSTRLIYSDGSTIAQDALYLHHLIIVSATARNLACPEYGGFNTFAGTGVELTVETLRFPYAVRIDPEEEILFDIEIMNPSATETIEYSIVCNFVVADWTDDIVEVEGYYNTITGCEGNDDLIFDIEQSSVSPVDNVFLDFELSFTGELVYCVGHLHSGGKNIYLSNMETGEVVFTAMAHYDDPENPSFLTSIDTMYTSYKARMHDRYRITAVYDSTEEHKDVMAIVGCFVVVEEVYSGDPPIPQYFGHQNVFDNAETGELVGQEIPDDGAAPIPPPPPPPPNQGDANAETSDDNLTVMISMIVVAFILAAVLLVVIVAALIFVAKQRLRRTVVVE